MSSFQSQGSMSGVQGTFSSYSPQQSREGYQGFSTSDQRRQTGAGFEYQGWSSTKQATESLKRENYDLSAKNERLGDEEAYWIRAIKNLEKQ